MRRSTPRPKRVLLITLGVLAVTATTETTALALQGGEDPALLPVLLDKRYGSTGRHKLALLGGSSTASKLVDSVPLLANYQYHFMDMLGVGITAGYFFSSEASIVDGIRASGTGDPSCQAIGQGCEKGALSDLFQLQLYGGADILFVPLYGKISFASEWNPSFQLMIFKGFGGGLVRREQNDGTFETKGSYIGSFGLGLRLDVLDYFGFRFEFRTYYFPEPAAGVDGITLVPTVMGGLELTLGGS